jgi:hypothetical protein
MPWTFYNSSGEAMIQDGGISIANNTNHRVVTATGASPASLDGEANLTFDGTNLTLGTGNVIVSVGKGIDFSAQANPASGMADELLDHYEEGTFTPTVVDADGDAAGYVSQVGRYTRIGDTVFFDIMVRTNSISGMTGGDAAKFGGLPFTTANTSNGESNGVVGQVYGLAITAGNCVTVGIPTNVTHCLLYVWDSTTGTSGLTVTQWSADGNIRMSGRYKV